MTCSHAEAPLRDLRDEDVRVVAARGGDEDVGLLDARRPSSASISIAVPTVKRPPASSHEVVCAGVEALVRERVLVEDGDGVTRRERGLGDGRTDATRPDDEDHHAPDASSSALGAADPGSGRARPRSPAR